MKKIYFLSAGITALTMLGSCSSDNTISNGGDLSDGTAQEIVIQVSNTGSGLTTRAGRPLVSTEANQAIENVKIIVVGEDENVAYVQTISDWNTSSAVYADNTNPNGATHGRWEKIDLKDKVEPGLYTVYAIGYHNSSDYNIGDGTNGTTPLKAVVGSKFNPDEAIILTKGIGEEIFAGSCTIEVIKGQGFKKNLILTRQVAGVYGYFKSIPYYENLSKLRLVTESTLNSGLMLDFWGEGEIANNGNNATGKYVLNNAPAKTLGTKVIYEIDLKKWFKEIHDKDGIVDSNPEYWEVTDEVYKDYKFQKGSVFGGSFIVPFKKGTGNANTFVLQLISEENGSEIIRQTWPLVLPNGDSQLTQYAAKIWDNVAAGEHYSMSNFTDTKSQYSVLCNHLYGIGKRFKDYKKPGPDPDPDPDPDPEDDDPQPLATALELTLRVNDNWQVIHMIELGE